MSPTRKPHLELVDLSGDASEEEKEVVRAALEKMVEEERQALASSLWLRASRSQGRRLGMLDYRDRLNRDDAWRLSARFPFGGREYSGLHGRGDAK
ncbi:MAG: hypothetical protein ACRDKT_01935 [Actinomycetota bacterium]